MSELFICLLSAANQLFVSHASRNHSFFITFCTYEYDPDSEYFLFFSTTVNNILFFSMKIKNNFIFFNDNLNFIKKLYIYTFMCVLHLNVKSIGIVLKCLTLKDINLLYTIKGLYGVFNHVNIYIYNIS